MNSSQQIQNADRHGPAPHERALPDGPLRCKPPANNSELADNIDIASNLPPGSVTVIFGNTILRRDPEYYFQQPVCKAPEFWLYPMDESIDKEVMCQVLQHFWASIVEHLERPFRVIETADYRAVNFLDVFEYRIDRSTGRINVLCIEPKGEGDERVWTLRETPNRVSLDLPLFRNTFWLRCRIGLRHSMLHTALLGGSEASDDVIKAIEEWLITMLDRASSRYVRWEALRRDLRRLLALNPDVLDITRKSINRGSLAEGIYLHEYNFTIEHWRALRRIRDDNPRLLWIWKLACDNGFIPKDGEPIAEVKQWLLGQGVSQRGWRILSKSEWRDFWLVVRDWNGNRVKRVVEWLRLHDELDRTRVIARALLPMINRSMADPDRTGWSMIQDLAIPNAIFQIALDEAEKRISTGTHLAFLRDEAMEVAYWCHTAEPRIDSNLVKSGWNAIVLRARQWASVQDAERDLSNSGWTSLVGERSYGQVIAIPLNCGIELCREGQALRHCVVRYVCGCILDKMRFFSLRAGSSGKRLATAGLRKSDGRWLVYQVTGFANKPASGVLQQIADDLCREYERLDRAAPIVPPKNQEQELKEGIWCLSAIGMAERQNEVAQERFGKTWFFADLTLCDAYLRTLNLNPVCDGSVRALIIDRHIDKTLLPEVATYCDIVNRVPVEGVDELCQRVSEDDRCVWISTGTSFGLNILTHRAAALLTPGQLVGVAQCSALNSGYAGLILYEWTGAALGRQIIRFYGGKQAATR